MARVAGVSVFDLDNTLLKGTLSYHFFRYLCQQKAYSVRHLIRVSMLAARYRLGWISVQRLIERSAASLFRLHSASFLFSHLEEFAKRYSLSLFQEAVLRKVEEAREHNHYLVLATSCPRFLVEPLLSVLSFDLVIATHFVIDDTDRLVCAHVVDGEEKKRCIEACAAQFDIPKGQLFAYSDSIADLPLLEAVGHPVVVNPDRKLRRHAYKNHWEVL